jgi:hypothetical protein
VAGIRQTVVPSFRGWNSPNVIPSFSGWNSPNVVPSFSGWNSPNCVRLLNRDRCYDFLNIFF